MTKYRHTNQRWEPGDVKREKPRNCPVTGKRMYASEREANAAAAHRMTEKNTAPAQLRTYKCPYCQSWHLTSKGT